MEGEEEEKEKEEAEQEQEQEQEEEEEEEEEEEVVLEVEEVGVEGSDEEAEEADEDNDAHGQQSQRKRESQRSLLCLATSGLPWNSGAGYHGAAPAAPAWPAAPAAETGLRRERKAPTLYRPPPPGVGGLDTSGRAKREKSREKTSTAAKGSEAAAAAAAERVVLQGREEVALRDLAEAAVVGPGRYCLPRHIVHVIQRIVEPRFLSCMASYYDVASHIGPAPDGGGGRCAGSRVAAGPGHGLYSSTFQLNLSRVLHKIHPKHPLILPNTPCAPPTPPHNAPPIPQKALTLN